jgi:hypothetical protein
VTIRLLPPVQHRAIVDAAARRGSLKGRVLAQTNVQWALVHRGLAERTKSPYGFYTRLNRAGFVVAALLDGRLDRVRDTQFECETQEGA